VAGFGLSERTISATIGRMTATFYSSSTPLLQWSANVQWRDLLGGLIHEYAAA
jgi:hypothetical protein